MAIVFDSDAGTITGISVGGLPDGVVDAGTLASNAVTEAKIASSAVVTAKLNDDAVTNAKMANDAITEHELAGGAVVTAAINDDAVTAAKMAALASSQMPAGSVIQVVTGTPRSSSTSTTTSGSWTNGGVSVAITPSSTSSKILVLQTILGAVNNSNPYTRAMYTLQRSIGTGAYSIVTPYTSTDGGGNVYGGLELGAYNGATELNSSASLNHLDSPSTTSECTYLVYFRGLGGYGTARIQKGSTIMAMEIAG
jgi:hypothetical protein